MKATKRSTLVSLAVSVYRVLLVAYPKAFRQEYGPHMLQVFGDHSRHIQQARGLPGLLWLWTHTLLDLARTVIEEQLERGIHMSKTTFIRMGGWALMLGGALYAFSLMVSIIDSELRTLVVGLEPFFAGTPLVLHLTAQLLFIIGLLALRARYRYMVGVNKSRALLIAAGGAGLAALGTILMLSNAYYGWVLWAFGNLTLFGLLTLFSVFSFQTGGSATRTLIYLVTGLAGMLLFVTASSGISDLISAGSLTVIGACLSLMGISLMTGLSRDPETT